MEAQLLARIVKVTKMGNKKEAMKASKHPIKLKKI